ncbi:hypothetical protein [Acidovorax sp. CCYZU-2555]|uniref:hypothetical protein n=1 Tax=Acidovorax sp. CCYZU-2555 TaxID=2835042 RepID=UPI001BCB8A52|nr:hypothetical protein [Acidovorax sp. CCYZU-2555]MBS7777858.1 hypothetical protein [Acidovorax sp. CCYZU-2555]
MLLAGCASHAPSGSSAQYTAGRAQLALPAGAWTDLGAADEAWAPLPTTGGKIALRSRALVLRGAKQEPLAVVLVRTNASNLFWKPVSWGLNCPRELDVLLFDEAAGSPDRMDCLRLRRNAQAQQWLKRSKPETEAWLAGKQQLPVLPYSHLSYRFATEDGGMVELQILADQRLLQPEKGSQGRQLRDWALAVASAARDSLSSLDGELRLPPFPGSV